jgi:UDPglucose 6-dehydrogenase
MTTAEQHGRPLQILEAVESVNAAQKTFFLDKIEKRFGSDLSGHRFAVWGLAFKPQTDDMREAPSVILIEGLLERGATVLAYDPEAMKEARHHLQDRIVYAGSKMEALKEVDALILVTEWHEFRNPEWVEVVDLMRQPIVFDGRNIFDPDRLRGIGFEYHGVGRS